MTVADRLQADVLAEVALVIVCGEDGDDYGIFSTLELASAWADTQESACVVVYPYVVDQPEYGSASFQ